MTVAVSCNLSDGVILGVDSAVTLPGQGGARVYETAEKLFQLGDCPIGVAIYGLGGLGSRTIGSYLREFEVRDPDGVLHERKPMDQVVESLRNFFMAQYLSVIAPALEAATGKPYADIPPADRPGLEVLPAVKTG